MCERCWPGSGWWPASSLAIAEPTARLLVRISGSPGGAPRYIPVASIDASARLARNTPIMLSRLASRGSYGWLFAGGLVAGIATAVAIGLTAPAKIAPEPVRKCGLVVQPTPACTPHDELIRATAVIHFFDNEVAYATAEDPMSAKAVALLDLPMMCNGTSEYSYPALSRHIESAATIAAQRGDKQMAMRLIAVGRSYRVDARMLDTLTASIVK